MYVRVCRCHFEMVMCCNIEVSLPIVPIIKKGLLELVHVLYDVHYKNIICVCAFSCLYRLIVSNDDIRPIYNIGHL